MGCCLSKKEKKLYIRMPDDAECAICLDPLNSSKAVEFAPCAHAFHKHCLRAWKKRKPVCPMCEHPLI